MRKLLMLVVCLLAGSQILTAQQPLPITPVLLYKTGMAYIVRSGQLAGGLYVGPPGSAKAFTKLLQQPLDLTPVRAELRAGSLDGLKRLVARG